MSFEKEFDRIIKQKLQGNGFAFDENNWEKAQQLIDAQRKSQVLTKGFSLSKVLITSAIVGIVLLGTLYYFNRSINNIQKQNKNTLSQNSTVKADVQINTQDLNTNKTKTVVQNETLSGLEKGSIVTGSFEQNLAKQNTVYDSPTQYNPLTTKNSKQSQNQLLASTSSQENFEQARTSDIKKINQQIASANEVNRGNSTFTKNENNTTSPKETKNIIGNSIINNPPANEENLTNELLKPFITDNEAASNQTILKSNINEISEPVEYLQGQKQITFEMDSNLKSTDFVYLKSYDDNFKNVGKKKTHFLNIGAGINYLNGWSAPAGRDGNGLNYFAALNYGFYVSQKMMIGAGIDFYNIQNVKQAFYVYQKTEYSFGSTNTYTALISNDMKYLGIPLKVYYSLNPSNIFSFGLLPSILLSSNNTTETYKLQDGQKTNLKSETTKVVYDGVAQKNIQFMIGYQRSLSRRISLQADLMTGVTDLFKNNESNTLLQMPVGVRLGLQINIFDK